MEPYYNSWKSRHDNSANLPPYQFAKDSHFGGTLSLQINHMLGYQSGIRYYRIHVGSSIRLHTWLDLKLNLANGKYEIPVPFQPMVIAGQPGFYSTLLYSIHQPGDWFMNANLGMILQRFATQRIAKLHN